MKVQNIHDFHSIFYRHVAKNHTGQVWMWVSTSHSFPVKKEQRKSYFFFPFRFDVNWSLWSLMLFHCYYRSLHSFWIFEIKSSFIDESQSNISLCCAWTVDYRNLFNLSVKINFDLLQGLNGDEGIQHNDLW